MGLPTYLLIRSGISRDRSRYMELDGPAYSLQRGCELDEGVTVRTSVNCGSL